MGSKRDSSDDSKMQKFTEIAESIRELLAQKQAARAVSQLRGLASEFKDLPEYHHLMGDCLIQAGKIDKAIASYRRAIEIDNSIWVLHQALAHAYIENDAPDAAVEHMLSMARSSDDPFIYYDCAVNLLDYFGKKEDAASVVEEIKEHANRGMVEFMLGRAAMELGMNATAIEFLRSSIVHGFIDEVTFRLLGHAFAKAGYLRDAAFWFRLDVEQNPDVPAPYEALRDLHIHGMPETDEEVIEALSWKLTQLGSAVDATRELQYLGTDEAKYSEVLSTYLDTGFADAGEGFSWMLEAFSCFYMNLMRLYPQNTSFHFIPADALQSCVERMSETAPEPVVMFYRAWLLLYQGNSKESRELFELLRLNKSEVPERLWDGIDKGLRDSDEAVSSERTASKSEVVKSLGKFGVALYDSVEMKKRPKSKRLDEIAEDMLKALSGGARRSVLLTGADGIGRNASIRSLACALKESKQCPDELRGFDILRTSTIEIMSGAKYIGMWQERLIELCSTGSVSNKIILYLKDIANVFRAGSSEFDSSKLSDYLIPKMESKEILVIGTLTPKQAEKILFEEPRFDTTVTEIRLEEPDDTGLREILTEVAETEASAQRLRFSREGINEIIDINRIFVPYRAFPGKGISLLRQVVEAFGDRTRQTDLKVTKEEVMLAFCEASGIPSFIVDKSQLLDTVKTKNFFEERILGQSHAISSMADAVVAFKARLCDPAKPIKSFLFVGPTGVGKTESAKVLAEYLFGSRDRLIRLNMSEYNAPDAVSRILGSDSRSRQGRSEFLDKVRRFPFSVILLDEIEKAHRDVFNLLLQLLDEGVITDSAGVPVNFQSTVIIMTSNIGAHHYTTKSIGFGGESNVDAVQNSVLKDVQSFFSPEIYNRFDEVICFKPLTRSVLDTIINREVGRVLGRRGVAGSGASVEVDPLTKDMIVERGFDPRYGARNIKRAVERAVALPLARLLATEDVRSGSVIRINVSNGEPRAFLIAPEEFKKKPDSVPDRRGDVLDRIEISDKGIRKSIESVQSRIVSLKEMLDFESVLADQQSLQKEMSKPGFWDKPESANSKLRAFAELNRKVERVHKWERMLDGVLPILDQESKRMHKAETARIKSSLAGLLRDLESAELEILLEGKFDSADAFLMLMAKGTGRDTIKWLCEVNDVYSSWTRRRGYQYRIVGESFTGKPGDALAIVHIGGLNAFGLLKNERGVHRKRIHSKSGPRKDIDCTVLTLADVQPLDDKTYSFDIQSKHVKPARKGVKLRNISASVSMKHDKSGTALKFFTDSSLDKDPDLYRDFFMSYLHYTFKRQESISLTESGKWGSLVRTYDTGDKSTITDHETGIVIRRPKDYLGGKIDSLLLERLG